MRASFDFYGAVSQSRTALTRYPHFSAHGPFCGKARESGSSHCARTLFPAVDSLDEMAKGWANTRRGENQELSYKSSALPALPEDFDALAWTADVPGELAHGSASPQANEI
jgi:hypothetical protein